MRRGWPFLLLILTLMVLPIAEVWLLVRVGEQIGLWPTVGILIVEAVLGGWLMRREGRRAWAALNATFASGRMPTGELADAALILVGGVLLTLPGFLTDIIGFVFLLPVTRPLARKVVAAVVARRVRRLGFTGGPGAGRPGAGGTGAGGTGAGGTVIEGEVVPDQEPNARVILGQVDRGSGLDDQDRKRQTS